MIVFFIIAVVYVWARSMCKAAADADLNMKHLMEERKRGR